MAECRRHQYERVPATPAVNDDGSITRPTHEVCRRCGKHKRGSFSL